jgi:uncharacterized protein
MAHHSHQRPTALQLSMLTMSRWIVPAAESANRRAQFMVLWAGAVETVHEDIASERLAASDEAFWEHHSVAQVRELLAGQHESFDWPDTDPVPALAKLTIPGLWMYGDKDRNVDADLSMRKLDQLILRGHVNYSYRVIAGANHFLYARGGEVLDPTVEWIGRVSEGKGTRE